MCAPHPQQGPIPAFEGYGESGLLTQEALKEEIKQSIRLMVSTRPAWGKYLDPRLLTAARRTPEQEAAAARQEATRVERLRRCGIASAGKHTRIFGGTGAGAPVPGGMPWCLTRTRSSSARSP